MIRNRIHLIFLIGFICVFVACKAQTVNDCDNEYTCFTAPQNCVNQQQDASNCNFVYKFKTNEKDDSLVDFVLFSKTTNLTKPYLAIGFNTFQSMNQSSIVLCKTSSNVIDSRFAAAKTRPSLVKSDDSSFGLSNGKVSVENEMIRCEFSRKKSSPDPSLSDKFLDLVKNSNVYILAAKGELNENDEPNKHINRVLSSTTFNFGSDSELDVKGCGSVFNCYAAPEKCVSGTDDASKCDFVFKFKPNDANKDLIDFILLSKTTNLTDPYLAIGFNYESKMINASIIMCKGPNRAIESYFATNKTRPVIIDPDNRSFGISNQKITISGELFRCEFSRLKSSSDESRFYDLSLKDTYYVLAAKGNIVSTDNEPRKHMVRDHSENKFDFDSIQTTTTSAPTTTTKSDGTNLLDASDCEKSYGCFATPSDCIDKSNPSDASKCNILIKYRKDSMNENLLNFELIAKSESNDNTWIGLGFSFDKDMPNTNMIICKVRVDSQQRIESSFAAIRDRPSLVDTSNPSFGLTNPKIEQKNGVVKCSLNRIASLNASSSTNQLLDSSKFFDLNQKSTYYLLSARGSINEQNEIREHSIKYYSGSKVDFDSFAELDSGVNMKLLKAHGSMMIIAWVLFASIGILFPRYLRFMWPEKKYFNLDFWFVAHRTLMSCVPLFSLIGFVLIFAFKNWQWVDASVQKSFAHSIVGILAIALSMLQVLGGLLRPDKESPKRPYFNWAHRLSGILTYLLSAAAISLGFSMTLSGHAWLIVLIWLVWLFIVPCLFEWIDAKFKSSNNQDERTAFAPDLNIDSKYKVKQQSNANSNKSNKIKQTILTIHVLVQIAITILFIVRIILIKE